MIIQETPTLNLQFDKAKNDSDMLSLLKSQGGTFTRGSEVVGSGDSVASYVDALGTLRYAKLGHPRPNFVDGVNQGLLIEEARTNLLQHSENFDNAYWSKVGAGTGSTPIVTANAGISPNGSLNADRVKFALNGGASTGDLSIISRTLTVPNLSTTAKSIYLKSFDGTNYDLVLYESTTATGTNVKKITITGEWQRFDVFGSVSSTSSGLSIGLRNISVTGLSNAADVLIWGAQLEEGSFATTYIPTKSTFVSRASTATYFDQNGVLQTADVNVARDNNYGFINGKWVKTGLLAEEARTNLLTLSEDFSSNWLLDNTTVSTNSINSPSNSLTADSLLETAVNSFFQIRRDINGLSDNAPYVFSLFIKKLGRDTLRIYLRSKDNVLNEARWNFSTEKFTNVSLGVTTYFERLKNDWYKVSLVFNIKTGATTPRAVIQLLDNGEAGYLGDITKGVYLFGADLQAGSFPTSYIPTAGTTVTRSADITTSATVTRGADNASITGTAFTDFYNQEEGSFLIEANYLGGALINVSNRTVISVSDGSSSNRIIIYNRNGYATGVAVFFEGANQMAIVGTKENDDFVKAGLSIKNNSGKLFNDGSQVGTEDTSLTMPIVDRLIMENFSGHIKRLIFYPKALPNADLQLLTRI